MSNSKVSDSTLPQDGWAEVRARDQIVRYRRSGAGRTVLLLHAAPETKPLWPELLDALASGFRLIVPSAPSPDTDVDPWLSALLDGLGVGRLTVIASGEFCMPAMEHALLDPDHVAAIIMVCPGRGNECAISGSLGTTNQLPAVPLLMLRRDRPAAEILPLVLRFLKREGAAAAA